VRTPAWNDPLLILAGAADVALILAGDAQADTLRVALVYLRDIGGYETGRNGLIAIGTKDANYSRCNRVWLSVNVVERLRSDRQVSSSREAHNERRVISDKGA
jgi:hypothetical protein